MSEQLRRHPDDLDALVAQTAAAPRVVANTVLNVRLVARIPVCQDNRPVSIYSIMVASCAIESHLDPPSVGDHVAWSLLLLEPDPAFAPEEICCVLDGVASRVDDPDLSWSGSLISCGGLVVAVEQELVADTRAQVQGLIFEESFDGIPEAVPKTAGTIKRIQVIRMEHLPDGDDGNGWVPVPGTLQLREVETSPKSFDVIEEAGGRVLIETGVLIDLEVTE